MTVALPTVARLRVRFPALDPRVVGGVVLVAASVLGGLRLAGSEAPMSRVWVATAPLDEGHVLTAQDLEAAEVGGSPAVIESLSRTGHGRPIGRTLRVPLRAGAAVPIDALGAPPPAGREITIPATPEHALGGAVRAGDRVDLLASFDKGTDAARTVTVTRGAKVEGVVRADGLFGQREGALTALTLLVDPDDALAVAFATRNADIDVVRAHGNLDGRGASRIDGDSLR